MKILLAGTPDLSIPTFEKIIQNFEVVALITQPDKPVGRKKIITPPPAYFLAKKYNIKIFQPEKISNIYEQLKQIDFDIFLTMAYGQIIPQKILDLSKIGSFNIHASLLPKYRGASPIQYCLINGELETGITLMEMIEKMDAGDILFQTKLKIEENDNFDSLLEKISLITSQNIVDWLLKIKQNDFKKIKQNELEVTFAPKITKDDEILKLDTIEKTLNKIRGLSSNPGAYLILNTNQEQYKNLNGKRVKIYKAQKIFLKNALEIKCSDGIVYASKFQFEGKNKISI